MAKTVFRNLQTFVGQLRKEGSLIEIEEEVSPDLELAEIHRRVVTGNNKVTLLFKRVKGSQFPVVTNLYHSLENVERTCVNGKDHIQKLIHFIETAPHASLWDNLRNFPLWQVLKGGLGKKKVSFSSAPVAQNKIDKSLMLNALPMTKSWPLDGGFFFTLPLVYTERPLKKHIHNLGIYRMQRYSATETGMHWQIDKGGGFHYGEAERIGQNFPVQVFLGGPPCLILSAIAPLPENLGELLLASFLLGEKIPVTYDQNRMMISEAEFSILGTVKPHTRRMEGPFGDHYGYYSLEHEFPVFECEAIYHRHDAIMPATVVGKPRQEDYYIGEFLQDLMSPLFPMVMPGVQKIWAYGETGFHALASCVVSERYPRESMKHAFRILGEGQLSLTKFLLVVSEDMDLSNFKTVLTYMLERLRPETDIYLFPNLSMDTLDYSGPEINKGSKGLFVVGKQKVRDLPEHIDSLPEGIHGHGIFAAGCLALDIGKGNLQDFISQKTVQEKLKLWPLIVITDNVRETIRSSEAFLWKVFIRFDPARDLHAGEKLLQYNHVCLKGPVFIDCRGNPRYPGEVISDPAVSEYVKNHWQRYFGKEKIEMGEG